MLNIREITEGLKVVNAPKGRPIYLKLTPGTVYYEIVTKLSREGGVKPTKAARVLLRLGALAYETVKERER